MIFFCRFSSLMKFCLLRSVSILFELLIIWLKQAMIFHNLCLCLISILFHVRMQELQELARIYNFDDTRACVGRAPRLFCVCTFSKAALSVLCVLEKQHTKIILSRVLNFVEQMKMTFGRVKKTSFSLMKSTRRGELVWSKC